MPRHTDEKPEITVRRAAMNLLARREQSFHELFTKLAQKHPELDKSQVILPALERLRDENLQSDERFVESYVRYRLIRGNGPLKITIELRQKGVNENLIRGGVYADNIKWNVHCSEVLFKKFGSDNLDSQKVKQKCYLFLSRRGFDGEHIRDAMGFHVD